MSEQGQNGKKSAAIWQPTFYFPSDTALLKALYLAKFEASRWGGHMGFVTRGETYYHEARAVRFLKDMKFGA